MFRQLLTLLAVLTGLTAAVAPAQAMQTGMAAVQVSQDAASCQTQAQSIATQTAQRRQQRVPAQAHFCRIAGEIVQAPTVILRVDRAHE